MGHTIFRVAMMGGRRRGVANDSRLRHVWLTESAGVRLRFPYNFPASIASRIFRTFSWIRGHDVDVNTMTAS